MAGGYAVQDGQEEQSPILERSQRSIKHILNDDDVVYDQDDDSGF